MEDDDEFILFLDAIHIRFWLSFFIHFAFETAKVSSPCSIFTATAIGISRVEPAVEVQDNYICIEGSAIVESYTLANVKDIVQAVFRNSKRFGKSACNSAILQTDQAFI